MCIVDDKSLYVEDTKQQYSFDQIFNEQCTQVILVILTFKYQLYSQVAQTTVRDCLNGVNGTVIAYG